MTPIEIIVGAFAAFGLLANTGLLWRIGLKVGTMEGAMTFVKEKIQKHNNLVERVMVLEFKEKLRGPRSHVGRTVEPDRRPSAD